MRYLPYEQQIEQSNRYDMARRCNGRPADQRCESTGYTADDSVKSVPSFRPECIEDHIEEPAEKRIDGRFESGQHHNAHSDDCCDDAGPEHRTQRKCSGHSRTVPGADHFLIEVGFVPVVQHQGTGDDERTAGHGQYECCQMIRKRCTCEIDGKPKCCKDRKHIRDEYFAF